MWNYKLSACSVPSRRNARPAAGRSLLQDLPGQHGGSFDHRSRCSVTRSMYH